jgi:hypothetical protein
MKTSLGSRSAGFGAALVLVALSNGAAASADDVTEQSSIIVPMLSPKSLAGASSATAYPVDKKQGADRKQYRVPKSDRGKTLNIPEKDIVELCADRDGCSLRLGMYNWDNSGRVASRESLFYYNHTNHAWRASSGDGSGTDYNGPTEHVMNAWACYFTDGAYQDWKDLGDSSLDFGLLSWNQYDAECWLTIID